MSRMMKPFSEGEPGSLGIWNIPYSCCRFARKGWHLPGMYSYGITWGSCELCSGPYDHLRKLNIWWLPWYVQNLWILRIFGGFFGSCFWCRFWFGSSGWLETWRQCGCESRSSPDTTCSTVVRKVGPRLREVEQPSSESILKLTPAKCKEDFGRCWRSHVEPWKRLLLLVLQDQGFL